MLHIYQILGPFSTHLIFFAYVLRPEIVAAIALRRFTAVLAAVPSE